MKTCKRCNLEKELTDIVKDSRRKDGYTNLCKLCDSISKKKYREENKEYFNNYNKRYKEENKEYFKEYFKEYVKNNDSIKEYQEEYRKNNKECRDDYNREYYLRNSDYIKENVKKYRNDNKYKINENIRLRRENDNLFALSNSIRKSILKSIKLSGNNKQTKTTDILGCSFEELKTYLESKFEDWMTWENRGLYNGELNYGWDIDHKIPLASAVTVEEIILLNNYSNLQPLCSKINRDIKKDKLDY